MCDGKDTNHAVNVVGYGKDSASGLDYWVLRNSWGSWWGQGGYMLIQRGVNKCDMESDVFYVVAGIIQALNITVNSIVTFFSLF